VRKSNFEEVDIRYVVTSPEGLAQHLYEVKLHKAQLALDRMSCHCATANQVRLALPTPAF
jgi:hypothetical protein